MGKITQYRDTVKARPGEGPEDLPKAAMFEGMKAAAGQRGQDIARAGAAFGNIGAQLFNIGLAQKKAENATTETLTRVAIGQQADEIFLKHQTEIQDPVKFEAAVNSDIDKLIEREMKGKNQAVRRAMDGYVLSTKAQMTLGAKKEALRKLQDTANAADIYNRDHLLNRALKLQKDGDTNALSNTITEYTATVARNTDAGLMTQAQGEAKVQSFTDAVRWSSFEQALQTDPTTVGKDVEAVIKNLGLSETQAIKARSRAEVAVKSEKHKFDSTRGVNIERIIATGQGLKGWEDIAPGVYGEEYADVQAEIDIARNYGERMEKFRGMPQDEILTELDELHPANMPVSDNPDRDFGLYGILSTQATKMLGEREKDPFAAVSQQAKAAGGDTENQIAAAISLQEQIGVRESRVMSNATATDILQKFNGAISVSERITLMDDISASYGRYSGKAIKELVAKGLPTEALYMIGNKVDGTTKQMLAQTMGMTETQLKKLLGPDEKASAVTSEVAQLFNEDFGNTIPPGYTNNKIAHIEVARKLALLNTANGKSARDAYDSLYGGYHYVDTLRIPKDTVPDKKRITKFASWYQTQGIMQELSDIDTGKIPPADYLPLVQSQGRWFTNDDETGMVLYDHENKPVLTKDGEMLQYRFDQIGELRMMQEGLDIAGNPIVKPPKRTKTDKYGNPVWGLP